MYEDIFYSFEFCEPFFDHFTENREIYGLTNIDDLFAMWCAS